MKNKRDLMTQIIQKNNLGDQIPEGAKKKPEDHAPKVNHHALFVFHFALVSWIMGSSASHHMAATQDILSYLNAYNGPPILMGDDSPIKVVKKGRVELDHGSFENVLHVPQISVNLLSMYHITVSCSRKKVYFTPDSMSIFNMQDNSKIVVGEINHQSWLYTFSKFIEPNSYVLLTHVDDSSRLWHKRFGHLNLRYMQQLIKKGMVTGLPDIHFSKWVCEGCVLGKNPQEMFESGKAHRASSPLDLIHSDLMGPFPHPSISKERYVLTFLDDYSCYTWVFFLR
jgi:hypothetical protein